MANILIIAHAPLASALYECAVHIYGKEIFPKIEVLDVPSHAELEEVFQHVEKKLTRLACQEGVLVLTDIMGASPCNISTRLAQMPLVRVLAGTNLPMLVRAICYSKKPLDELAVKVLEGGMRGIVEITAGQQPENILSSPCGGS